MSEKGENNTWVDISNAKDSESSESSEQKGEDVAAISAKPTQKADNVFYWESNVSYHHATGYFFANIGQETVAVNVTLDKNQKEFTFSFHYDKEDWKSRHEFTDHASRQLFLKLFHSHKTITNTNKYGVVSGSHFSVSDEQYRACLAEAIMDMFVFLNKLCKSCPSYLFEYAHWVLRWKDAPESWTNYGKFIEHTVCQFISGEAFLCSELDPDEYAHVPVFDDDD